MRKEENILIKKMYKSLTRVIKSGWVNFYRNKWLSLTSVLIMVLTLLSINSLLFVNLVSNKILSELQNKIDISVYFKSDSSETDIFKVRDDLIALSEVKNVEYISKDQALENFKERHKDNPVLTESLDELGDNPLTASLNIKANTADNFETKAFESIAAFLEQDSYKLLVEKVNYNQNKEAINKLSLISQVAKRAGLILTIVLAVIASLVAFNTIRLTMYSWRDEITVMRLVGATNWYIRGPFLVEGILYGVFAALVAVIVLTILLLLFSSKISAIMPIDLSAYFKAHFLSILSIQFLIGVILGGFSSFFAIRRYLKV
ncbi:MAG: hypothetical protein COU81_02065 [Candidatus Portnoybacteria bacterium CG10_big_fil_rev_8_21_14_0_10_36_7]|uniref:Cell division protein FtsX n=1 Tax=Candidatus Portnoybacteria bacterium CG10_big_fil_rev_8_21_14_0_10_36_7 TaxID=1974812 RepID=A0A2M8KE36_9BACT|nr:MAG: hypothetical protein COU81_02065 [Candidatus Portnoybacteria bacterium CG10_big_fil_rev_8_21_14_0_10_36_7]